MQVAPKGAYEPFYAGKKVGIRTRAFHLEVVSPRPFNEYKNSSGDRFSSFASLVNNLINNL